MQRKAEEWESSLRRSGNHSGPEDNGTSDPAAVDFTGKRIFGVTVLGESVPVGSYKEALLAVARRLQAKHPNFDSIVPSVRGRFPYFSEKKSDLRNGEKLENSRFFIETHNSAERQYKICASLVRAFGYNPADPSVLRFEVTPNRTRALKRGRRDPKDIDDLDEL